MKIRATVLSTIVVAALVMELLAPVVFFARSTLSPSEAEASVIVRAAAGRSAEAEEAIEDAGGTVTQTVPMIDGLVCTVPSGALASLWAEPSIAAITDDGTCRQSGEGHYRWTPADDSSTVVTPTNVFLDTTRVRSVWRLWQDEHYVTGRGVTVAVIDSGVSDGADFRTYDDYASSTCLKANVNFTAEATAYDGNGHGTHVAGVLAGDGSASSAGYSGVAPDARLINLKVSGADAQATEADVLEALQWVYDNRDAYNIRVVNLSLNSDVQQSYKESPIDAACEILWFNGIVVVASAGNSGPNGVTLNAAPANDPFVITVGATDEAYTASRWDDSVATFSTYGVTQDGFAKPDLYAPGRNIYGTLSRNSLWANAYPERLDPSGKYFRMSGTSVAAPVVAGTVALMLQQEPSLTPDQVKSRLTRASNSTISEPSGSKKPYLDAYASVTSQDTRSANTGIEVSTLLTTGDESILTGSVMWNSVMWNSVMWNSVMWNSVMWNSVMWNSVMWNSGETLSCQSVMWH